MSRFIEVYLGLLVSLLLCSCGTTRFSGNGAFTGRICGPDGTGIPEYKVTVEGEKQVLTNQSGFFVLPQMKAGVYKLTGSKKNWSSLKAQIDFYDKKTVWCFSVEPVGMVYRQVEALIKEGLLEEAEALLKTEKKANGDSSLYSFYQELIQYSEKPKDSRLKKLLKMTTE